MVTNHGYTTVLRETNSVGAPGGVVSYALLPGALRADLTQTQELAAGGTAAQAHATCSGTVLDAESNILAWQEGDPFYNYVPFQKAPAGLDDNPADWIDDVQRAHWREPQRRSATLPPRRQRSSRRCVSRPLRRASAGFSPRRTQTQNTIAALASGTVAHATGSVDGADHSSSRRSPSSSRHRRRQPQRAAADARAAMAAARRRPGGGRTAEHAAAPRAGWRRVGRSRSVRQGDGPRRHAGRRPAAAHQGRGEGRRVEVARAGQGDGDPRTGRDRRRRFHARKAGEGRAEEGEASGVYFAARSGDRWATTRKR